MSTGSSKRPSTASHRVSEAKASETRAADVSGRLEETVVPEVPWHAWLGVIFILFTFFASQIVAGLLVSIYPLLQHQTSQQAVDWINNSPVAQFVYIALAEGMVIGAIYWFLRIYKVKFSLIGLKKPRWSDPLWGLAMVPVYYILYLLTVGVVSHFVPSLNVNQQQDIGFTSVHGAVQLILTFISLVLLPPFTEELMVRGFLYSSLRKAFRAPVLAVVLTSLLFASAHLPEGGAAGPLYIAALDTFVLSLVLIFIREKTGSLWGSMTLHAIKNGIAFVALFVLNVH